MTETTQDSTKVKIIAAATPIFAEKGFDGATVREICKAADVNLALVNYHFGGKDKLYEEVIDKVFEAGPGQLRGLVETVRDDESWRQAIKTWITNSLNICITSEPPLSYISAFAAQAVRAPKHVRETLREKYSSPLRRDLNRLIRMAMPEGMSQRDMELEASLWVASLEAICNAHIFMKHERTDAFRPEGVTRAGWIKAELEWMTRGLFAQLHFVKVVD